MRRSSVKQYRVNLPCFEKDEITILTFVKYNCKSGLLDLQEKAIEMKFSQLYVNADYLGCEEILSQIKEFWAKYATFE